MSIENLREQIVETLTEHQYAIVTSPLRPACMCGWEASAEWSGTEVHDSHVADAVLAEAREAVDALVAERDAAREPLLADLRALADEFARQERAYAERNGTAYAEGARDAYDSAEAHLRDLLANHMPEPDVSEH